MNTPTREEKIERIVACQVKEYVAQGKCIMLHHTEELLWHELTDHDDDYIDNLYHQTHTTK